ncbi:MAG: thioredoxin family protein [Burkholderiaceae bacterium]|nr:thioredoxin family protein [Burkholderiaceae bacterium]
MQMLRLALTTWLAMTLAGTALAQPQRVDTVVVELVAESAAIVPGASTRIGLRLVHDPEWHTYWRNPGDSGLPTRIELALPAGFSAGPIEWPAPQRLFIPPLANYGYEGEVVLPLTLAVPTNLVGESVRIDAQAAWLVCREVCVPGEASLTLTLPIQRSGTPGSSQFAALFEKMRQRTPSAAVPVAVSESGGRLSLSFASAVTGAEVGYAEFFPYAEGVLANAAPQRLYRVDASTLRLEVERAKDEALPALPGSPVATKPTVAPGPLAAAEGVIILDGWPFEVKPSAAAGAARGSLIATVPGSPASARDLGRDQSLVSRLLEGAGIGRGASRAEPAAGGPLGTGNAASSPLTAAGGTPVTDTTLSLALLFALLGGMILNLMPCVFPVVGLKLLGFAGQGAGSGGTLSPGQRRHLRHGAASFALGVLVSFWLLAALLLALRSVGEAAGWGFQLQSPGFVAGMALLFVIVGLNFSGVFEFGASMTRLGEIESHLVEDERFGRHRLFSSFGSGVLAVLVATPCSAPFMGSALGFTLSQPAPAALAVFTALGVGMALPYVLLGIFPGWLRLLPKPGRWMETFKELLAFPMYATAAWLAWVLGRQTDIDAVFGLVLGAILVALAAWVFGRFVQLGSARPGTARRAVMTALAVALLMTGLWAARPGAGPASALPAGSAAIDWQPWSQAAVAGAVGSGHAVFVDFTADWCVSCKVNEKIVLDREEVGLEFKRRGVKMLRADWTRADPAITAELARHGRNGVPLYLLYVPGEARPRVLPEILTVGTVMAALAAVPVPRSGL